MLINLKQALKEGDKVQLVLNFNQGKQVAGAVGVQAPVKAALNAHTH
jgi:copper(I)-binding protein